MLDKNTFAVKVHVKFVSLTSTYDIFDAESGAQLGVAQEQMLIATQLLRWVWPKQLMSTAIEVRTTPDDQLVFSVRRGPYLFRPRVEVLDANGAVVGYCVRVFTLGGGFYIYDKNGRHVAETKVKWTGTGRGHRFLSLDGVEMARVSKEPLFGAFVKDLFTSPGTCAVQVSQHLSGDPTAKILILATVLAIDTISREMAE